MNHVDEYEVIATYAFLKYEAIVDSAGDLRDRCDHRHRIVSSAYFK